MRICGLYQGAASCRPRSQRQGLSLLWPRPTGLRMTDLQFVGEYAGRVSANQVFIAEAEGSLQPNPRYLQGARWWDCEEELPLQDHVNGILAFILERTELEESAGALAAGNELSDPYDEEETQRESADRQLESGELDLEEAVESTGNPWVARTLNLATGSWAPLPLFFWQSGRAQRPLCLL